MSKQLRLLGLLLLMTSLASAQNLSNQNLETLVQKEVDSMGIRLSLSPAQQVEVTAIQRAYYDSVLSLSPDLAIDLRTTRMDSIVAHRDQALRSVLTPSQWSSHQAYLVQRQQAVQQVIQERRNRKRAQLEQPN